VSGFLCADEAATAEAAGRLGELDPAACRASAARRFDVDVVSRGYERVYGAAAGVTGGAPAGRL
jgi:hypothetical protein